METTTETKKKNYPTPKESLLDITQDLNRVEQAILAAGGEVNQYLEEELTQVEKQLATKVDAYDFRITGLNNRAELFRTKAAEFQSAARALETYADRLKDRIKFVMIERGTPDLVGNHVRFKLSSTKPSLKIDLEKLPAPYKVSTITYSADRKAIEAALKEEKTVPGVTPEQNWSLRTYPNAEKK